jgi:hypothetical protein
MELNICFEETNTHWLVFNDQAYIPSDGYNCGPIACLRVMEIYGFLEAGAVNVLGDSVEGYQLIVLNYFNSYVMKYNINLIAYRQKRIIDKINCNNSRNDDIDEKKAASFPPMVNNFTPVVDPTPNNERLPLDSEELAEECNDNNGLNTCSPRSKSLSLNIE